MIKHNSDDRASDRQLTRHGSGLSSAIGVVFEVICNRCILPLDVLE
ncbi:hypothetical protein L5220_05715 [Synechococcus sp. PCC 6716]|nr:hypothetical protein [Synechococcus sp. PCC 6716]